MNKHVEIANTQVNVLPQDGGAYLIDDNTGAFDWSAIMKALSDTVPWQVEKARIFGRELLVPRLTAWFGDAAYTYSGVSHQPAALPPIVQRLRARAEALSGGSFNAVLLNQYRDGSDSVGWHSDDEASLGEHPTIASLSLGANRTFKFRHNVTKRTISLELKSGQWLIMTGKTQAFWQHQVPKTAKPVQARINLTFRHMLP